MMEIVGRTLPFIQRDSAMTQELVLIASVVLGVILVPSLITVRPSYLPREEDLSTPSSVLGGQPTE